MSHCAVSGHPEKMMKRRIRWKRCKLSQVSASLRSWLIQSVFLGSVVGWFEHCSLQ